MRKKSDTYIITLRVWIDIGETGQPARQIKTVREIENTLQAQFNWITCVECTDLRRAEEPWTGDRPTVLGDCRPPSEHIDQFPIEPSNYEK